MTLGKFQLKKATDGICATSQQYHFYIEGVDVSHCVQSVNINMGIDCINTVDIRFVGEVELDPAIDAEIRIFMAEQAEGETE